MRGRGRGHCSVGRRRMFAGPQAQAAALCGSHPMHWARCLPPMLARSPCTPCPPGSHSNSTSLPPSPASPPLPADNMRREGFELSVSPPKVVLRMEGGERALATGTAAAAAGRLAVGAPAARMPSCGPAYWPPVLLLNARPACLPASLLSVPPSQASARSLWRRLCARWRMQTPGK